MVFHGRQGDAHPTASRILVLALAILVAGGSLLVVPHAAAADGDLTVTPGASSAGAKQVGSVRTIQLANGGSSDVTVLEFEVSLQGTKASPKELRFTADNVALLAPGVVDSRWKVSITNNGCVADTSTTSTCPVAIPHTMKFTATGDASLGAGGALLVRIGVDVLGTPAAGASFPVTIRGRDASAAEVDSLVHTISIDTVAPLFATTGPVVVSKDFGPSGIPNGHLDTVDVFFNEDIAPTTVVANDFTFSTGGYQVISAEPLSNAATAAGTSCDLDLIGTTCNVVRLHIQEGLKYDTGALPKVQYTQGSLTDLSGNLMRNANKEATDGAKPLLAAAVAQKEDTGALGSKLLLWFSEAVNGGGGATDPVDADGPGPLSDQIVYLDEGCSSPVTCDQSISSSVHAAATSNRMTVNLDKVLTSADVSATLGDRVCPVNTIMDKAGNTIQVPAAAPTFPLPPAAAPFCPAVSLPTIVEAEVNIGSLQLTLRFNGPTETAAGGALQPADLDIINTEVSGGGPTGITKVFHEVGADRAILTLTQEPVRPTDVDQTPSRVRVLANVIHGTGSSTKTTALATEAPMVDRTPPSIRFADTLDANGDGFIDGYGLTFSEPIDDSVFLPGLASLSVVGHSGFSFNTGVQENDDKGLLLFSQSSDGTGVMPNLAVANAGLFEDLACNGDICQSNQMQPVTSSGLVERDGASPVVRSALTTDNNEDGILDGYVLVFSEAILDSTYNKDHWRIDGRTPGSMSTGAAVNDDRFTLTFSSISREPDTDQRPQLTYVCPLPCSAGSGLQDRSPALKNPLQTIDTEDVDEKDGAKPVIVRVQGFEDRDELEVVFSEPVDDGTGGPVVRGDLVYSNVNAGATTDPSAPKDRVSGFSNSLEVQHSAGAETAVVPLNNLLTLDDIQKDKLLVKADAIRETAPHKSPSDRLYVPAKAIPFSEAPDVIPPGAIEDLEVVTDLVTPNTVRLTWTAPADDGTEGNVTAYLVKYSKTPITATNFDVSVTAVTELLPANTVGPGAGQAVKVLQLEQKTTYYFAVKALDEANNLGGISNVVSVTTANDQTRPEGSLVITSPTHPQNQPKANPNPRFLWSALVDPESDVLYRYARNSQPGYEAKGTDNFTRSTQVDLQSVPPGTWYFHVAAESAGGPTPTAHYKFIVSYPEIPEDDFLIANTGVETSVFREGGDNIVSWVLPAEAGLPGTLEGLKIWRLENGEWTEIEALDGTYDELAAGNYTDDNGDGKDSRYLVTMVFRDGQEAGALSTDDYPGTRTESNEILPTWVWILLGVTGALIVAGLVVFFILRRRAKKEALAKETAAGGYAWEEEGGKPSGTDPKTGLPIHEVKCPTCSTQFQATGNMPLDITCPSCGVKGTLS